MALSIDMTGKAALVTGAASGLGRATAVKLAQAGADLCIVDVNADALVETAGLLGNAQVLRHVADLSDPAACKDAVAQARRQRGALPGNREEQPAAAGEKLRPAPDLAALIVGGEQNLGSAAARWNAETAGRSCGCTISDSSADCDGNHIALAAPSSIETPSACGNVSTNA